MFDSLSFKSKYSYRQNVYDDLDKLIKIKPTSLDKIKEKEKVYIIQQVNYVMKRLKIIMVNLMNYQMLKKISLIKLQAYKLNI